MTVFKILAEIICLKELFSLVVFSKLTHISQMFNSGILVIRKVRELLAVVTVDII
jgi:Golgi nucleoside diphosphatase